MNYLVFQYSHFPKSIIHKTHQQRTPCQFERHILSKKYANRHSSKIPKFIQLHNISTTANQQVSHLKNKEQETLPSVQTHGKQKIINCAVTQKSNSTRSILRKQKMRKHISTCRVSWDHNTNSTHDYQQSCNRNSNKNHTRTERTTITQKASNTTPTIARSTRAQTKQLYAQRTPSLNPTRTHDAQQKIPTYKPSAISTTRATHPNPTQHKQEISHPNKRKTPTKHQQRNHHNTSTTPHNTNKKSQTTTANTKSHNKSYHQHHLQNSYNITTNNIEYQTSSTTKLTTEIYSQNLYQSMKT